MTNRLQWDVLVSAQMPHRIQLWFLKTNLQQHSLPLLSLLPMRLLLLLR